MKFVLALDQGTTSSRAVLFDEAGAVRSVARREVRQIYPQPGWVEHDPEAIWRTQLACARRAMSAAGVQASDIAAIGIANQRETVVVWDRKSGLPVHNAIVWQDRRTADYCERLKRKGCEALAQQRTGLLLDPYFSASKVAWILDSIPGIRVHAERGDLALGTIDSWLIWKLTGGEVHATDCTNASRTQLYDIHSGKWDDDLLAMFDIPRQMLPVVRPSAEHFGSSARKLFGMAIPITGVAGDQQAALFGQACHRPGMAKNTYGTGCFLLLHTGEKAAPPSGGLLTTLAAPSRRPQYALEGSVFIAGAVLQWLKDGLRLVKSSAEAEKLAASVPDTGDVYLVPAFTGLGAPFWDPRARGTISGLTRGTTSAHLARAAIESIAYQTADVLEAMREQAGVQLSELRVDGGASNNAMLMQFQADLLGVPLVRPQNTETTAIGAAHLAGLSCGLWKDIAETSSHWHPSATFEPRMSRYEALERMARWKNASERARNWAID